MTKTELLSELAKRVGITTRQAADVWEVLTELAYREARKGQFVIPGIGKVIKQRRNARMGRKSRTGTPVKIPAKFVLTFLVEQVAKDAILEDTDYSFPDADLLYESSKELDFEEVEATSGVLLYESSEEPDFEEVEATSGVLLYESSEEPDFEEVEAAEAASGLPGDPIPPPDDES